MPETGTPVLQQESWLNMRLYQVGTAIYALGEHRARPTQHFFLTIVDGRVFENLTPSAEVSPETKPFVDLTFKTKPRLTDVENNIVQNLTQNNPELRAFDGWQIVLAHTSWSIGGDYPDESALINWIPNRTADNMFAFMQNQIGSLRRTIGELETYVTTLGNEKRELRRQLDDCISSRDAYRRQSETKPLS